MVKSDWRVDPLGVVLAQACPDIWDNLSTHLLAGYRIHTLTTPTKINSRVKLVTLVQLVIGGEKRGNKKAVLIQLKIQCK